MSEPSTIPQAKPYDFTPRISEYLSIADSLCQADEPERALKVLEQLPGYYRDHVPSEIVEMRAKILHALITPHGYASIDFDSHVKPGRESLQLAQNLLRGQVALDLIDSLDNSLPKPHIVDVGPGEYWLPIALTEKGAGFTYQDVSLLNRTGIEAHQYIDPQAFAKPDPSAPHVFVAFELIEHLPEPRDLAVEAIQHCNKWPEYVLLSTPMYCFDTTERDWAKLYGQAHLRTYTPQEFFDKAREIFPGYTWELKADKIMVLKGVRNGTRS